MGTPRLPNWVAPFCCAMPFFALVGFSIAASQGSVIGTPGLVGLTILCGKTTEWVLRGTTSRVGHQHTEFKQLQ